MSKESQLRREIASLTIKLTSDPNSKVRVCDWHPDRQRLFARGNKTATNRRLSGPSNFHDFASIPAANRAKVAAPPQRSIARNLGHLS